MNLANLTGEEMFFLRRLKDLYSDRRGTAAFSPFLTLRQLEIAQELVRQQRLEERSLFFGGFPEAQRVMLGVFGEYERPAIEVFPIQPITILYRQGDTPGHRDFLGACLGLLIKRESIGDIVPDTGRCTLFAQSSVAPVILQELRKVGSVGVRCQPGVTGEVVVRQEFEQRTGTVPSTRADCLVSLATGLSREKSAALLKAERVQLNDVVVAAASREFGEGDVLVIRGFGKYIVKNIGGPTRKGRLPVTLKKYM